MRLRSPRACRSMRATAASSATAPIADLDEHRELRDGSRQVIAGLQATYAEATGIKSLKVRHNNVLGYFVEVTATNAGCARQAAACRDVRPPPDARQCHALLDARAWRARGAHHAGRRPRARARDRSLRARSAISVLAEQTDARGGERGAWPSSTTMQVSPSLAIEQSYVRPKIDASLVFAVEEGRHPMVEQNLRRGDGAKLRRQRLQAGR